MWWMMEWGFLVEPFQIKKVCFRYYVMMAWNGTSVRAGIVWYCTLPYQKRVSAHRIEYKMVKSKKFGEDAHMVNQTRTALYLRLQECLKEVTDDRFYD